MYKLTEEQEDIISTAVSMYNSPIVDNILQIRAVAGSSKSYLLFKIAEELPHTHQRYITFLNALAKEASTKFPKYVECSTCHALGRDIVLRNGLKADGTDGKSYSLSTHNLTHRDMDQSLEYEERVEVLFHLERFYTSKFTTVEEYAEENDLSSQYTKAIAKFFLEVQNHKALCTHNFYLKIYHILLADGTINYPEPFDLLMLDEFGDTNEITLEIFLHFPAILKIVTGDPYQNIYSFNHTINGFEALKGVGETRTLSQSFRCSTAIADALESFCRRHLDSSFVFRGTEHADNTIRTEAIISRTNSGLIRYMIEMCAIDEKFNLTKEAKHIFATMLTLMNLKEGVKIFEPSLKFIQKDVDYYFKSPTAKVKYKSCLAYIKFKHEKEEPNIKIAINTIMKYGASKIYEAYKFAKECELTNYDHATTLTTCHSSKGLTYDKVIVADDFNLDDILEMKVDERSHQDTEELRLYYVCISRARLQVENAIYLTK